MKIVYDKKYRVLYSSDPAAMPRRMETIYAVLEGGI
jgi:hypothetical protein